MLFLFLSDDQLYDLRSMDLTKIRTNKMVFLVSLVIFVVLDSSISHFTVKACLNTILLTCTCKDAHIV